MQMGEKLWLYVPGYKHSSPRLDLVVKRGPKQVEIVADGLLKGRMIALENTDNVFDDVERALVVFLDGVGAWEEVKSVEKA